MCRRKASITRGVLHSPTRSLIEQSKRSGLKDVAESTAGIIPGDRGMDGDSWCCHPLQAAQAVERHISPVPLAGVVSGQFTHESGTERLGAIRNRVEPSQAHGRFRPVRRRSYPRGFRLLLRRPERSRAVRRAHPAKRPCSSEPGAQGRRGRAEGTNLAKFVDLPRRGGVKHTSPRCKSESNLRGKRSDPWHGANAPPKAVADPAQTGEDAKQRLQTCLNLVRKPVAQPSAETG